MGHRPSASTLVAVEPESFLSRWAVCIYTIIKCQNTRMNRCYHYYCYPHLPHKSCIILISENKIILGMPPLDAFDSVWVARYYVQAVMQIEELSVKSLSRQSTLDESVRIFTSSSPQEKSAQPSYPLQSRRYNHEVLVQLVPPAR